MSREDSNNRSAKRALFDVKEDAKKAADDVAHSFTDTEAELLKFKAAMDKAKANADLKRKNPTTPSTTPDSSPIKSQPSAPKRR